MAKATRKQKQTILVIPPVPLIAGSEAKSLKVNDLRLERRKACHLNLQNIPMNSSPFILHLFLQYHK
jgi:hypothetical protein